MAAPTTSAGAPESMKPYLRLQNLFVRQIDTSLPRELVIAELTKHCPPAIGRVVVPTSDATGGVLGSAYLNFLSGPADAARLLERMRFTLTVRGKPVRLTYAVDPRWRDHLFGPFGLRFQVLVKVRGLHGVGGGSHGGGGGPHGSGGGRMGVAWGALLRTHNLYSHHLINQQNLSSEVDDAALFARFSK